MLALFVRKSRGLAIGNGIISVGGRTRGVGGKRILESDRMLPLGMRSEKAIISDHFKPMLALFA